MKASSITLRQYAYNGNGERVRSYLGSSSTYSVYDEAGRWLGDYDGSGSPIQQAVWMDDLPVGLLVGASPAVGRLHYLQPDHLGTPRVVIEPARDVAVWAWDLKGEAFGDSAPNEDPDGDSVAFVLDMRFPGQRHDAASGLSYNYFRDYEAGTGRYVQSDPIGLAGGLGTYIYAANDPLSYIDPLGLKCGSGQVTVWTFKHGAPRSHCESSANPSGNLPYSNPTGDMAFFHPNTSTPKGDCQAKCSADFVLPGVSDVAEKGVDYGLGKVLRGAGLATARAFSKVLFFAKDAAELDQCLQKCRDLDGCEQ